MADDDVSTVDEQSDHKCIFCESKSDDLKILDCDHRACSSCLIKEQKEKSNIDVKCPDDDEIIDMSKHLSEDTDDAKKNHQKPVDTKKACESIDGEIPPPKNQHQQERKKKEEILHQQERKKKEETLPKGEIKGQLGSSWLLGGFFTVLVILIAAAASYTSFNTKYAHNYQKIDIFKQKLKKMERDFPNQDRVIWNMLKNGGARHLTKVHDGNLLEITPLSYHIAGYAGLGGDATVNCFVSRLAMAFTSDPVQSINSERFTKENDKGRLDNEIKSSLNGTNKFLAVKNINKLPFNVAQLFMSYSDERNTVASYPQSVMIVTTMLPFSYDPARKRHDAEGKVGEYYSTEVWAGVHADLSSPLWSRVGDGLILIREENTCISD